MSKIPALQNEITVRENNGADVGTRPRINMNEGPGISITMADDPVNDEVDITFSAIGGGGGGWVSQFYPAPNFDGNKGAYATMLMPDEVDTVIRQSVMIPSNASSVVTAAVVLIPDASGNLRRGVTTNFARICANEDYQIHTDSIAAGQVAVDMDQVECIDISAALTGALARDIIGVTFTRYASDPLDTIGETVHYLGIIIEGI